MKTRIAKQQRRNTGKQTEEKKDLRLATMN